MQATDNIGRMLLADYQTFPAPEVAQGAVVSRSNVIVVNPAKILPKSCGAGVELGVKSRHRKLHWMFFDGQSGQKPRNREQRPYASNRER